jgi:hypothetical protein
MEVRSLGEDWGRGGWKLGGELADLATISASVRAIRAVSDSFRATCAGASKWGGGLSGRVVRG